MRIPRALGPLIVVGGVVAVATILKKGKPLIEKIEQAIKDFGNNVAEKMKDEEPAAAKEEKAATHEEPAGEPVADAPTATATKETKTKKAPTKTANRKPKAAEKKPKTTSGRRRPASNVETG